MAQRRQARRHEEDYEEELAWLVQETARLKIDLRGLVASIPRAILAFARQQNRRPSTHHARQAGSPRKRPPAE